MKFIKAIFYFITLLFLCSCSSGKIAVEDVMKINGVYQANTMGNNDSRFGHYNFVTLLSRKLLRDTLDNREIYTYRFKLDVLDPKNISISILKEDNDLVYQKKYRYKRKADYILLKNKNTKPLLIPYAIGALDVTKLKLKSDQDKNLEVEINSHRSGGFFMIPMGWTNDTRFETYKRIK